MKVCDWYCIWSFCLLCSFWRHPSVCQHQDIRNLRLPGLLLRKADQVLPWHPPHLQMLPWHDVPVRFPRLHRYALCIRNATDYLFSSNAPPDHASSLDSLWKTALRSRLSRQWFLFSKWVFAFQESSQPLKRSFPECRFSQEDFWELVFIGVLRV